MNSKRLIPLLLTAAAVLLPFAAGSAPQAAPAFNHDWKKGRETGFPIPRFVSLKAAKAHMRVGPSLDYATSYVYSARGLPLEITEEYGHWRRVRDEDGSTGWMFAPLLSSRRTAVVGPWHKKPVNLRADPSSDARTVAKLAAKVRLDLSHCDGDWCRAALQDRRLTGFVRQIDLWGVYPGETFD
ncbi:SH3 domain-containing protein [Neorhizobium alkalisoli]|uniref:SH3-like domain-containing protein n=1 Tax=Neorhizobium alkalisoli TaxID=528178 RepID=A0A561QWJ3_9HYPH|nr:SH3 domain-containing protein [Neorhizobium alkalisoli]TWF54669.1 SH3-like domain-containing protein [Neorhizobium alkalisoli]